MRIYSTVAIVLLSGVFAVSACAPKAKTLTGAPIASEGSLTFTRTVTISGLAIAPAGVIANNGSGLVSDHGAGIVSNNAGGLRVLAGYHTLAGNESAPVAGATVRLLNQLGEPLTSVPVATTDDKGGYTLRNVPTGTNWLVVVEAPKFKLSTMVRPTLTPKPVPVTVASTLVTEYLRQSLINQRGLQQIDADRVASLARHVETTLIAKGLTINVSSETSASKTFLDLAKVEPSIAEEGRQIVVAANAYRPDSGDSATPNAKASTAVTPAPLSLEASTTRINTFLNGKQLGAPWNFGMGTAPVIWNGMVVQFFQGIPGIAGRCAVVDGPAGPFVLQDDEYNYFFSAEGYKVLGRPTTTRFAVDDDEDLGDTEATEPSKLQKFERGELRWNQKSGIRLFPGGVPLGRPAVAVATVAAPGGRFNGPVAVSPQGDVYAIDSQTNQIHKLSAAGEASVVSKQGAPVLVPGAAALAVDAGGNVFVADATHVIHKVAADGSRTIFAGVANQSGNVDGAVGVGKLNAPGGLAFGPDGTLYVADTGNHAIRKITPLGVLSNLAGGPASGLADDTGAAAKFNAPRGLVADASGFLYVADTDNHCVRQVAPDGVVKTLTGDGTGGSVDGQGASLGARDGFGRFNGPQGIALTPSGDLIVSESGSQALRMIAMGTGRVTTLAGDKAVQGGTDGDGGTARFNGPKGLAFNRLKGTAYMTETQGSKLRTITFR